MREGEYMNMKTFVCVTCCC